MPISITDPETEALVRQFAKHRDLSLTVAIKTAVGNELNRDGVSLEKPPVESKRKGPTALETELDAVLRSTTLAYTRLLAQDQGKKHVGSRIYQMLARHGAVETLRRLVKQPTEGLIFLMRIGRPELTAEMIALDPKFAPILDEDIIVLARTNLARLKRS